ncbi:MAG: sigma-54-dependent Fis family transcriptional regulator [Myxococcales bacterium]|nr:sigma-54-dependent Fis family transcriptional regulator [Myxococcales bacterium]MCB9708789.1 sigma-54-dependent Fis family transcriptional regulator [Myxococcales bacterium]
MRYVTSVSATILIIDDERNIRRVLEMVLTGEGFEVREAETAEQGLKILERENIDAVILDVRLPGMNGVEALAAIRARPDASRIPVLMISGHAGIQDAVAAVQLGATDFFEKPLDRERVLISVRNALKTRELESEVEQLRKRTQDQGEIMGKSPAIEDLHLQIAKVAPTNGRVLITGESGTGKELIARALYRQSQRSQGPFVKVNCAAIPGELIESELFGYEKGAFTGAQKPRRGLFEAAHHGTLFLDEIGDMSLGAQAKVLRVLQSGELTRVGSEQTITVDVRVIAATHRDLEREVALGTFREDLFFRLNVVPLRSPALRERRQDIPLLAKAFLDAYALESGIKAKPIDDVVLKELEKREWPGNVRELKNIVERMAILSGERISLEDLPESPPNEKPVPSHAGVFEEFGLVSAGHYESLREFRHRAERSYITYILNNYSWNVSRAASALGLERTNLHKKMRNYAIKRED